MRISNEIQSTQDWILKGKLIKLGRGKEKKKRARKQRMGKSVCEGIGNSE